MLTMTQVARIRAVRTVLINKATYPNVLDAIRHSYNMRGATEAEKPIEVSINISVTYLDRLESFLKDEVDLPGFYAFVEGRGGKFEKEVAYPMCTHALRYLLETLNGENEEQHGPRRIAEVKLPASGGVIDMPNKLVGEC